MCETMKRKKLFKNLGFWIIIALILGIAVGAIMGKSAHSLAPLGDIFMKLIKMVVVPLVAFSIISGAASIGESKSAGKIGIATFGYYLITTAFAVVIGLLLGEIFKPGAGLSRSAIESMFSNQYADKGAIPGFWDTLKGFIPENPIKALVDGNILQIIFFSLFLGFAISALPKDKKDFLVKFCNYITDALVIVITKVMYFAPIGVFALMADATGSFGYSILQKILVLFFVYLLALFIHAFGVYGVILKLFSKVKLKRFFSSIYKPQLVALSTASSMATIPLNLEVCEKELGVSKETASFVLPLGATINMDGNAIYYALVACFFAQLFGIDLGIGQYAAIIFTATIGSIGQAGVPGPTLLVVAVLISANIPVIGLPILFGVDRIFDMLRTAVNITGDASCAIVVDRLRE